MCKSEQPAAVTFLGFCGRALDGRDLHGWQAPARPIRRRRGWGGLLFCRPGHIFEVNCHHRYHPRRLCGELALSDARGQGISAGAVAALMATNYACDYRRRSRPEKLPLVA